MTALTRPIRRLLGRGAAVEAAPDPPCRAQSRAIDALGPRNRPDRPRHRRERSPARLPSDRLRAGGGRPPGTRLAAVRALREAGVALVVPLVSQGELIGTLNLGPRLSEQDYSTDDRRLLTTLAAQAAPAIRVAQLVREQAHEAAERERIEQEMRVATLIQQQFLPASCRTCRIGRSPRTTARRGRSVATSTTSSRCPAAASGSRSATSPTRACPRRWSWPGRIRSCAPRRAASTPRQDPGTGQRAARAGDAGPDVRDVSVRDPGPGDRSNRAGQCRPQPAVRADGDGVMELRATGMPLGLMPDSSYDETEGHRPGSNVLLYSDGLVEAHDPGQQMFGFPRLREAMAIDDAGGELLDRLLETLHTFTGPGWEQEDDITLVTMRRASGVSEPTVDAPTLTTGFSIPGEEGNERLAMDRVAAAVADLGISPARLQRLKTAVSEATMNAIEYGSQGRADVPVDLEVEATPDDVIVRITDRALSGAVPDDAETPDIDLKLAGAQKAARLGPLPHQEHGGCDGRDQRRDHPDGDPDDGARRSRPMDERRFGAEMTEIPDEVRMRLSGDLNAQADVTWPRPTSGSTRSGRGG